MLIELRLENYAVIDNAAVEFASGLNLLTGETGAGKSVLIDALALLLGDKASTEIIRTGADRAVISAVFESAGSSEAAIDKTLEHNGLDKSEDGSLIVRREISASGKGRVFVNNQAATVAVLRQLAPHLATIHAQNESILSFDAPARLALLHAFAGSGNFAADDQGAVFGFIQTVVLQNFIDCVFGDACGFEHGGDDRAVRAGANYFARCFIAQQQGQSVDQNGFACASLARQQVQAKSKLYREIVNDSVIFEPQFGEHELSWDA